MDVYEADIVRVDSEGEEQEELIYEGRRSQRVHLYPPLVPEGASAEARIWLLPVTRGLVRSALFFSLVVLAMLVTLLLRLPEEAERSAPTLLLALPGVVSLFLTRPGENPMASHLLLGLRAVVSIVGFLPFAGALLLILNLSHCVERWSWVAVTAVATIATFVVAEAYAASRRS
jgi:hypothetical protein